MGSNMTSPSKSLLANKTFVRRSIGILLIVLALLAQRFSSFFAQELIAEAAILGIFTLSLDLLATCGLVSFGHAGLLGVGAYVFGGMTVLMGLPPLLAIVAAVLGGIVVSFVVGLLAVRTSGAFFIMVTLAAAEMFYSWGFRSKMFNGADGMGGIPRLDLKPIGLDLDNPEIFALLCIALCVIIWLLLELVVASPFGRTLAAIRQNPSRVAALGGRVFAYRLAAFTASGAIAALSGALKVQHTNFISPDLVSWFVSGDVLIALVIGGMGTLVGGPLGAAVLVILKDVLSSYFGHWYLFLGAIFAFVALALPRGIVGYLLEMIGRMSQSKTPGVTPGSGTEAAP
jgi:branched-chain amino acid transport system permease protein